MARRLDRSWGTPALLLAALLVGVARMLVLTPGGARTDTQLEAAAFFGGVLGGALFPWAAGALVAYGHWFWHKTRRDREFMNTVYPYRRRIVLHATVLVLLALMVSELLWRLAAGAPVQP